ncbi:MAG: DNA repair protein RecO [Planctomycetota bacterium]|nr:DNA repair protein RecO [Planctomycetota bacterium]
MASVKDVAIVLRRLDYSETSQVLAMLTREHGQQRLIAKGIKRSTKTRTAVGIDLLELGNLVYTRRPGREDTLGTLIEWRQRENFAHLRRDLVRLYAAQYAAEVSSHLTEIHDPHPALFDALERLFVRLATDDAVAELGAFLWRMLKEIGLQPQLFHCVNCKRSVEREPELFFSTRLGGAVCRDCESAAVEKRRIDPAILGCLAEYAGHRLDSAPAFDRRTDKHARAVFDVLDYHLTETIGRRLRLTGPLCDALSIGLGRDMKKS